MINQPGAQQAICEKLRTKIRPWPESSNSLIDVPLSMRVRHDGYLAERRPHDVHQNISGQHNGALQFNRMRLRIYVGWIDREIEGSCKTQVVNLDKRDLAATTLHFFFGWCGSLSDKATLVFCLRPSPNFGDAPQAITPLTFLCTKVTSPFFCQPAGDGSGQHGLPKPLEDAWDGIEMVIAGVDAGKQGVELIGNAGLFSKWRNW